MSLGERIKKARIKAGMTQRQLSQASGVKQQMISKLETGKSEETSAIVPLANALGVNPDWLYSGGEVGENLRMVSVDDYSYKLSKIISKAPKQKIQAILLLLGIKESELHQMQEGSDIKEQQQPERRTRGDRRQNVQKVDFERRSGRDRRMGAPVIVESHTPPEAAEEGDEKHGGRDE